MATQFHMQSQLLNGGDVSVASSTVAVAMSSPSMAVSGGGMESTSFQQLLNSSDCLNMSAFLPQNSQIVFTSSSSTFSSSSSSTKSDGEKVMDLINDVLLTGPRTSSIQDSQRSEITTITSICNGAVMQRAPEYSHPAVGVSTNVSTVSGMSHMVPALPSPLATSIPVTHPSLRSISSVPPLPATPAVSPQAVTIVPQQFISHQPAFLTTNGTPQATMKPTVSMTPSPPTRPMLIPQHSFPPAKCAAPNLVPLRPTSRYINIAPRVNGSSDSTKDTNKAPLPVQPSPLKSLAPLIPQTTVNNNTSLPDTKWRKPRVRKPRPSQAVRPPAPIAAPQFSLQTVSHMVPCATSVASLSSGLQGLLPEMKIGPDGQIDISDLVPDLSDLKDMNTVESAPNPVVDTCLSTATTSTHFAVYPTQEFMCNAVQPVLASQATSGTTVLLATVPMFSTGSVTPITTSFEALACNNNSIISSTACSTTSATFTLPCESGVLSMMPTVSSLPVMAVSNDTLPTAPPPVISLSTNCTTTKSSIDSTIDAVLSSKAVTVCQIQTLPSPTVTPVLPPPLRPMEVDTSSIAVAPEVICIGSESPTEAPPPPKEVDNVPAVVANSSEPPGEEEIATTTEDPPNTAMENFVFPDMEDMQVELPFFYFDDEVSGSKEAQPSVNPVSMHASGSLFGENGMPSVQDLSFLDQLDLDDHELSSHSCPGGLDLISFCNSSRTEHSDINILLSQVEKLPVEVKTVHSSEEASITSLAEDLVAAASSVALSEAEIVKDVQNGTPGEHEVATDSESHEQSGIECEAETSLKPANVPEEVESPSPKSNHAKAESPTMMDSAAVKMPATSNQTVEPVLRQSSNTATENLLECVFGAPSPSCESSSSGELSSSSDEDDAEFTSPSLDCVKEVQTNSSHVSMEDEVTVSTSEVLKVSSLLEEAVVNQEMSPTPAIESFEAPLHCSLPVHVSPPSSPREVVVHLAASNIADVHVFPSNIPEEVDVHASPPDIAEEVDSSDECVSSPPTPVSVDTHSGPPERPPFFDMKSSPTFCAHFSTKSLNPSELTAQVHMFRAHATALSLTFDLLAVSRSSSFVLREDAEVSPVWRGDYLTNESNIRSAPKPLFPAAVMLMDESIEPVRSEPPPATCASESLSVEVVLDASSGSSQYVAAPSAVSVCVDSSTCFARVTEELEDTALDNTCWSSRHEEMVEKTMGLVAQACESLHLFTGPSASGEFSIPKCSVLSDSLASEVESDAVTNSTSTTTTDSSHDLSMTSASTSPEDLLDTEPLLESCNQDAELLKRLILSAESSALLQATNKSEEVSGPSVEDVGVPKLRINRRTLTCYPISHQSSMPAGVATADSSPSMDTLGTFSSCESQCSAPSSDYIRSSTANASQVQHEVVRNGPMRLTIRRRQRSDESCSSAGNTNSLLAMLPVPLAKPVFCPVVIAEEHEETTKEVAIQPPKSLIIPISFSPPRNKRQCFVQESLSSLSYVAAAPPNNNISPQHVPSSSVSSKIFSTKRCDRRSCTAKATLWPVKQQQRSTSIRKGFNKPSPSLSIPHVAPFSASTSSDPPPTTKPKHSRLFLGNTSKTSSLSPSTNRTNVPPLSQF